MIPWLPAWAANPMLLRIGLAVLATAIAVVGIYRIGQREAQRKAELMELRQTVQTLELRREVDRGVAAVPDPARVLRERWAQP